MPTLTSDLAAEEPSEPLLPLSLLLLPHAPRARTLAVSSAANFVVRRKTPPLCAVGARRGAKTGQTLGVGQGLSSPLPKLLPVRCGAAVNLVPQMGSDATATCASTLAPMTTAPSSTRR